MNKNLLFSLIAGLLMSCVKPVQVSTIDKDFQHKAENILLIEATKSNVDSALVLVMSVKTGEVKTIVKITKSDSLTYSVKYTEASVNTPQEPGSIFIPFSIMAAMEQSNVSLDDSVDTGNGVYRVSNQTFLDYNANQGGFGKISLLQSVLFTSNIGTIVTVGKAFNYPDSFIAQLQNMSIIQLDFQSNKKMTPDLIVSMSIGYNFKMTPLQIITCYNAIANNGKMMKAVFKTGQDSVINPRICSDKTIQAIQKTLCNKADFMMKNIGQVNKNKIAGIRGTSQQNINSSIFDFRYCCSYFPSEDPEYTCLIIFYNERNYEEEHNVRNAIINVVNQLAGSFK